MPRTKVYDTIVVGAGSAGCVLAARLTEAGNRSVLLLEAGPDYPDPARLPPDIASPRRPIYSHEWGYVCEPGVAGRSFKLPRARIVGGCSATNAAVALRGAPTDYADWAKRVDPMWAWHEVLPWFNRLESDQDFEGAWHGHDGPLAIQRPAPDERTPEQDAFLGACASLGMPAVADLNAPGAIGAGPLPFNVRDGVRQSAAIAYLAAARGRPALEVRAGVLVDRVVLEHGRAVSVKLAEPRETVHGREIVLAAGAYGSPAILLRSGIGNPESLGALGIRIVADRPGVGEGLADHPLVGVVFAAPQGRVQEGPLFQTMLTSRSSRAGESPDLQIFPRSAVAVGADASPTRATIMLFVALTKPLSRGRLTLRSVAPADMPRIDPGYLTQPLDLKRAIEGLRLLRRIAATPPMSALATRELQPGASASDTDEDLTRDLFSRLETYHHPVGTCAMGPARDANAVVDAVGRVHGVEGLRVVDASIMPSIPSANTNLPTLMIAERIAHAMRATS